MIDFTKSAHRHIDASQLTSDRTIEADVVIIGTGAGGGVAAEILAEAGRSVVMVEEGGFLTSKDFTLHEKDAYPLLYQESASRKTKDRAIGIYQGRTVGGSTTVNWTASFRTPPPTLEFWARQLGLRNLSEADLAPWFAKMEARLNISPWALPPNQNNMALKRGAEKLGIPAHVIPRNVKDCGNTGYCGMGCPLDAKQSMLVTTIPRAMELGATLVSRARAIGIIDQGSRVDGVICQALSPTGTALATAKITIKAKSVVLAAGAIGTPGILLRSGNLDPYNQVGRRTFLHPVSISAAVMPERVDAYTGAPQTIYSDHFLHQDPIDGKIGFKLEVPPLHPILIGTNLTSYGSKHRDMIRQFPYLQVVIALARDGFHPDSQGGRVELRSDGSPVLDYPITAPLWDAMRRAFLAMAEIQFAAGASKVYLLHEDSKLYSSFTDVKAAVPDLVMEPLRAHVVSAHVMGGCAMGPDEKTSVIAEDGRHHQRDNLYVFDGSMFPTSIGANPQLSIYGLVARNASKLAQR